MFSYVVFNVYQLSTTLVLGSDPLDLLQSFRSARFPALLIHGHTVALLDRIVRALENGLRVLTVALETLPPTVIVSLVYRLAIMYLATRVLVLLQLQTKRRVRVPENPPQSLSQQVESEKLSELLHKAKEPDSPNETKDAPDYLSSRPMPETSDDKEEERKMDMRPSSIGMFFVRYSRFILITVYSHLLCTLTAGHTHDTLTHTQYWIRITRSTGACSLSPSHLACGVSNYSSARRTM